MSRCNGYILLPVVLLISLVAGAAFILNNEAALETHATVSSVDIARADYVASAGLQHALWKVEQAGCGPYTDISSETFGNHSYSATITPNSVGGTVSTFNVAVSDDAWIKSDSSTQNYGNDAELATYFNIMPFTTQRALYRFDIATSGIPSGATVISAIARIFVLDTNDYFNVNAHQITADWIEATVNWDNINNNYDFSPIGSIPTDSPVGEYVEINITPLVQGWINGSVANQGIMLASTFIGDLSKFTSKEYGTTSQRPELVIKTVDGSLSNRADISVIGTLASGVSSSMVRADISLYQPPASVTMQPGAASGKDAEIWDQKPNDNYGGAVETWVSSASNDTTRSLLSFNMGEIPSGVRILEATLSLLRQSGSGSNQSVSAHRIINPWSEDSVTWNRRQPSTNWDTTGGDFENMAVATIQVGPTNQRYEWSIAPLVQGWVDGSYPNYGVVLTAAVAGMPGERFYTSDHADSSRHPWLTITYACECGITCQTPQGSGNILMAVGDDVTLSSADVKKKALFELWGYTVNLIDDDKDQGNFDAKLALNDVAYISDTVSDLTLGSKLENTSKGVLNEDAGQNTNLGLSSSGSYVVSQSMEVIDNSHYITALFPLGVIPINRAPMQGLTVSGAPASGLQTLGNLSAASSLAFVDVGGALGGDKNGENAVGRRVVLPIGSAGKFNWDYLNNNGSLMVQRAIQWGVDTASLPPPAKKVYWTDDTGEKIQRSDEDGSNVEDVIVGLTRPTGLDIDTVNGKIYWTNGTQIQRADMDGSNVESIYSGSINTFDIKLDVAGGKMYWTHDNGYHLVMRADMDGGNSETIDNSLNRPSYLTLDISASHIYLTEFGSGSVSRMNFNGNAVTTIATGPTGTVGSALDLVNGKVYWTGGASNDWIKRADLNGSNVETIVTGLNAPQDITYDADNDRIYWVDALNNVVQRAEANGANIETIVTGVVRPRGIVLVNANLVPATGGGGGPAETGSGCNGTFRDEFNQRQYDQNDGTLNWTGDWVETGESFNPTGGDIRIDNDENTYELKVRDDGQTIWREVDLSQAGSATLGFDYWRKALVNSSDYVAVEVSYNGGSSWVELDRFTGTATDSAYSSTSYILDAGSLSANTRIRFLTPTGGMSNSNMVLFDNVQIECAP